MERVLSLTDTSIGKKAAMAVSGVVMLGFVVAHMVGNLKLYAGPEAMNAYAAWLRTMPGVLWTMRLLLLFSVVVHIVSAAQLWSRNRAARPVRYRRKRSLATTYAARTMYWSGPILLLYILYHLAHLTFGVVGPYDHQNVYNNVVYGFRALPVALLYIVANLALGMHIYHGAWSFLQTLGASHPRYDGLRRGLAIGLAVIVTAANVSFPVAVLTGIVEPTTQTFCFPELAVSPGECG